MANLSGMMEFPDPAPEDGGSESLLESHDNTLSHSLDSVLFLILRRMRVPLLVLVVAYSTATIGLALMPKKDGAELDFFHAFYVISYTGPTIGYGELPSAFNIYQRAWVTFSIYLTVIVWVYSIGSIMMLLQDPGLRRRITERRFIRTVRSIREPFFLVCGYGDTGRALVAALQERNLRTVVIEKRQERINLLTMENYPLYIPALCADAGKPNHLLGGGLKNPRCAAVLALSDDNFTNLQVAIISKLLNPDLNVICRVDSHDVAANMSSFGTNYVINPFDTFGVQLHTALHSPSLHILREWLGGKPLNALNMPKRRAPSRGLWILCSYGRFGKAIYQKFATEPGIRIITIESAPQQAGYPKGECVVGLGTEAKTLQEAHVEKAVGIVVGTDDDGNNLSIIMTARELNPDLFVVLRQNKASNHAVFEAAHADIVMQPSRITAQHIRVLLTTPMLIEFIRQGKQRGEQWAMMAVRSLYRLLGSEIVPVLWENTVDEETMPALFEEAFKHDIPVTFECIMRSPQNRKQRLQCMPLLLFRKHEKIVLPEDTETIEPGDRILWCGAAKATRAMRWTLRDASVFHYIATARVEPRSYVWAWLAKRWQKKDQPNNMS